MEKIEIVNGQLLGTYLQEKNFGCLEASKIAQWNHGRPRSDSILYLGIAIGFLILLVASMFFLPMRVWPAQVGLLVAIILSGWRYKKEYAAECYTRQIFESAKKDIQYREIALIAIFPGYKHIKEMASYKFKDSMQAWSYCVDWVRAELIKIVAKVDQGDESLRGDLRVRFDVAKKLFGNQFDHGEGYAGFFSGSIRGYMQHFTKDLPVVGK